MTLRAFACKPANDRKIKNLVMTDLTTDTHNRHHLKDWAVGNGQKDLYIPTLHSLTENALARVGSLEKYR